MALTDKLSAIADAIRAKTGKTDTMTLEQMPTEIASITGGGGGSSADVRYVTFMNGNEVLYVKPVAVGDDCADIIARGLIGTPTKASTAQYNYGFLGWGAADNGAYDANILKNITEDKTVYAIYTAIVRLYTITWLDSDGATVLDTTQVAYGTVPSLGYTPTKSGCTFDGWDQTPVAVTGDATYTAVWIEKVSFANSSWADIALVCESGKAQETFALGDTRTENLKGSIGNVILEIIGFSVDKLADGTGNAAITVGMRTASKNQLYSSAITGPVTGSGYQGNINLKNKIDSDFSYMPAELKAVIKPVLKETINDGTSKVEISEKLWMFSGNEVGFPDKSTLTSVTDTTTKYPGVKSSFNAGFHYNAAAPLDNSSWDSNNCGYLIRHTLANVGNGVRYLAIGWNHEYYDMFVASQLKATTHMRYGFCI